MPSSDRPASVETLPNEILASVLESFATTDLLPLASVSHRFHLIVARLLHRRLIDVASLPQNGLILECYHPSAKLSTPYLTCQYLGTKTRGGDVGADGRSPVLSDLRRLYSSFRPAVAEENRRRRNQLFDGGPTDDTATEDVYLDEDQLFSQLCAVTNVVKAGPRPGLFSSHVNISDGVLRVWREWLAGVVAEPSGSEQAVWSDRILWVDEGQSVGVRFRVMPGRAETMPVLSGPDDHPPVNYRLQYEELLVRTRKLLLAAEKSVVQEVSHSGDILIYLMTKPVTPWFREQKLTEAQHWRSCSLYRVYGVFHLHRFAARGIATTHDTFKIPPFKMFARNPRNTWLPRSSPVLDRLVPDAA